MGNCNGKFEDTSTYEHIYFEESVPFYLLKYKDEKFRKNRRDHKLASIKLALSEKLIREKEARYWQLKGQSLYKDALSLSLAEEAEMEEIDSEVVRLKTYCREKQLELEKL